MTNENITGTPGSELDLANLANLSLIEAESTNIVTDRDYQYASQLLVDHKKRMKQIKDYWEGPKTAAKAAHQEICDREKAMLEPFSKAETIIKGSMLVYQRKVAEERMAAELEARRLQKIEADRLLAESIKAEEEGKTEQAATTLEMASVIERAPIVNPVSAPKAEGIGVRKTWKARVINASLVPAYYAGIELRTINQSALNELARKTNGESPTPGVEFYEDMSISARA